MRLSFSVAVALALGLLVASAPTKNDALTKTSLAQYVKRTVGGPHDSDAQYEEGNEKRIVGGPHDSDAQYEEEIEK